MTTAIEHNKPYVRLHKVADAPPSNSAAESQSFQKDNSSIVNYLRRGWVGARQTSSNAESSSHNVARITFCSAPLRLAYLHRVNLSGADLATNPKERGRRRGMNRNQIQGQFVFSLLLLPFSFPLPSLDTP